MQGTVRALFIKPEKKATRIAVSTIQATATGLDGDFHSRIATRRQILIVSGAVLNELGLEPGSVSENMVVDGIDVMALPEGHQLRIGQAILEITVACQPCAHVDRIREGLKLALKDRRGMFAMVVAAGEIRTGDPVRWEKAETCSSSR